MVFLRVTESKSMKNRLHLCLRPAGTTRDAEVERILALGARMVDDRRATDRRATDGWAVPADPEGDESCVLGTSAEDAGISE
ncbi:VOC family protein [Clavibacter sepedonicus]|nr:VOC family protein [Clavibacter sepedonicus]UUK66269.1 VOC family protein [Clavibacter sepedonicus]